MLQSLASPQTITVLAELVGLASPLAPTIPLASHRQHKAS